MNIGIILLARMSSTRLPGKVMMELCGKPVLAHIVNRLKKVRQASPIIVATTFNPADDAIVEFCKENHITFFRGSEDNVLTRCIGAGEYFQLEAMVRLGADSPLIDWEIINDMLNIFLQEHDRGNPLEYMGNGMQRSFPVGLDADIMTMAALRRVDRETRNLPEDVRKLNEVNVIPYIHQNPGKFKVFSYYKDFDFSHYRWTLDTPEDFELISRIYQSLYPGDPNFLMRDILALLEKHPHWCEINSGVIPRSGHWTPAEKLKLGAKIKKAAGKQKG